MTRNVSLVLAALIVLGSCTTTEPVDETTSTRAVVGTSSTQPGPDVSTSTEATGDTTDTSRASSGGSIVIVVDAIRAVALADTVARFTSTTGVDVILDVQPPENILTRAGDDDVDIFMGPHIWRDNLIDQGLISVIDDMDPTQWTTRAAEAFTTRDGMVAVPFSAESLVLYARTNDGSEPTEDLLAACGPSSTSCFVMPGFGEAGGYHLAPFLMADAVQDFVDQLHDPVAMSNGVAAFVQLAHSDDHVLTTVSDARVAFLRSTLLFVGGPWDLGPIEDSGMAFSVAPLPRVGNVQLSAPVSVQGFYLSSTAPNFSAATTFLSKFITLEQPQRDLWLRDRRAPVSEWLDDLGPIADAFAQGVEQGFLLPQGDLEVYWEELGAAAEQIYAGADPLAAIVAATARIDRRLP